MGIDNELLFRYVINDRQVVTNLRLKTALGPVIHYFYFVKVQLHGFFIPLAAQDFGAGASRIILLSSKQ
jgi:hypothetical protein